MSPARPEGHAVSQSGGVPGLLASRVIAQVLGAALTVLLAARLGVTGFGVYAFVGAIVFVANVVTTFGTDMILIRDIAAGRAQQRCAAALALQVLLSLAAIAFLWAVATVVPVHGEAPAALRILSLSLLPAAVFNVCTAVLRGAGAMRAYALVGVTAAAAPLATVVAFVPGGAGVERAAVALVAAQTLAAVAAWTACAARTPDVRVIARVGSAEVVAMARACAPVGVLGVLGVVYQRCGAVAVALVAGPVATGWLAGASRITEASKTGHVALFTALYPAMAEAHAAGRSGRALRWSSRVSVAGAVLIAGALLLAGPALVDRMYGAAFAPARTGLALLALAVVPSTMATHQSLALVAAGRARETLRALAVSLAVQVAATAALVPAVGWLGACWALLLADATNASLLAAARHRAASRRTTPRGADAAPSPLRREAA